ncbi:MAG TPA: DNA polymerase [Clostridia bacterium]|nr:DNA polymerase [Clostridia bacterium]
MRLNIDIETFSDVNLIGCGAYKYIDSNSFEILLFAYAFDDDPVQIIDLASGERLPEKVFKALTDPAIIKSAFNAQFERICINKHFNINSINWECTMIKAWSLGITGGLEKVGQTVGLEPDMQKLMTGKNLIRLFSVPRKVEKSNQLNMLTNKTRIMPQDRPEEWEFFKAYCIKDVEAEREIYKKLKKFKDIEQEKLLYELDQKINDRGILIDLDMVRNALAIDTEQTERLTKIFTDATGLENPNSLPDLKRYIKDRTGKFIKSINKDNIEDIKEKYKDYEDIVIALDIRQALSKTSISKYKKMLDVVCRDDRARGILQFYGAGTGRWSGRNIQVHNLPQNHIPDLNTARNIIKYGDLDLLEMTYDNPSDILSQCIRPAIIPAPGKRFIVSDFSAIEARIIAWIAGEKWRLDVFNGHGKIYEASASQMFSVPIEEIDKGSVLRQKGKIAELACIAEGQLVLTDKGLVPIERVTLQHKVFDGATFVHHDGVVFKGIKEVITYEGLTATKDHLVWIKGKCRPIQFGLAAASGAHLLQSRPGRKTLWSSNNNKHRKKMEKRMERSICPHSMYKMQKNTMDSSIQSHKRKVKRMPTMFTSPANTKMVRSKIYGSKTKMYKSKRCRIQKLWGSRNRVQIQFCFRSRPLDDRKLRSSRATYGNRQNRCRWSLRTGKFKMGHSSGKLSKSAKVYDILNCGENNRFTVSGVLVHNCGYQGSVGALKQMGALKMGLKEKELKPIINRWRSKNSKIVQFWYNTESKVMEAIANRTTVQINQYVKAIYKSGILFLELPSGRKLAYPKPKIMDHDKFPGRQKITFEGMNGKTKQWGRIDTYGGKLVENIVQATARDCLAHSMLKLDKTGYDIVMHVHDEIVIEIEEDRDDLKKVTDIMGQDIPWAKGLPMRADGFYCEYYQKD